MSEGGFLRNLFTKPTPVLGEVSVTTEESKPSILSPLKESLTSLPSGRQGYSVLDDEELSDHQKDFFLNMYNSHIEKFGGDVEFGEWSEFIKKYFTEMGDEIPIHR